MENEVKKNLVKICGWPRAPQCPRTLVNDDSNVMKDLPLWVFVMGERKHEGQQRPSSGPRYFQKVLLVPVQDTD
jgi:hypothetical protein